MVQSQEPQSSPAPSVAIDNTNTDPYRSGLQLEQEDQDTTYDTPVTDDITTSMSVEPSNCRPRRAVRAPPKYEPETGKWVSC